MPHTRTPIHLAKLLAPHSGKWVTLSKDERVVLGVADTIDSALEQARQKGEFHPLLIKAPDSSAAAFFN